MLNYIWGFILLAAVIFGIFTGRIAEVGEAAIAGAGEGATLVLGMLGVMCFWTGLMEIAEKSGVIHCVASLLRPLTRFIFPKLEKNDPAHGAIVMNIAANLLGMGNAATPLGLRAMQLLDERNCGKKRASNEMCLFVLINTASLQLFPTTLLLLRQMTGSANPGEIIVPVWIVSISALFVGIFSAKLFQKRG
ncbi:MAG: nucleoside recognition protein [Clostridia bacterium]|nr:nucleoside recognition protein [Oscillospiraceae bacterium]MBQ7032912.1 nucleoside recognition protein [Clostridia bacterium]